MSSDLPTRSGTGLALSGAGAWGPGLLLAAGAGLFALACLQLRDVVADDAYITFRYARNLAEGLGPVFNPGERVEGYSNPLWMLAVAAGFLVGLEPLLLARVLSLACAVALAGALYRGLVRAGVAAWGAALATLWLATSPFVQMATLAGLETVAFTLFFFAGLLALAAPGGGGRRVGLASVLLVLASLTRPEGIAYWAAGGALVVLRDRRKLLAYALPGLVLVAHFGWRWSYYGELLPNTYYAKASSPALWGFGLRELGAFLARPAPLLLLISAAAGGAVAWRRPALRDAIWLLGGTTAFHLAYVVSVGGDAIGMNRFQVPVLPSLAFLAGLLFLDGAVPLLRAAGALGIAAAAASSVQAVFAGDYEPRSEWMSQLEVLGRKLARERPPDTLIAVSAAGVLPYYSGLPALDLLGLTDARIARAAATDQPERAQPGHMKWDIGYVAFREPDLIVNDLFVPTEKVGELAERPLALARGPMWKELYGRFLWDERYEHRPIDLGNGSSVFVFERRADREP